MPQLYPNQRLAMAIYWQKCVIRVRTLWGGPRGTFSSNEELVVGEFAVEV